MAILPFGIYEEPIDWALSANTYSYIVPWDISLPALAKKQANAKPTVFEGIVLFTYDQNGWRIHFVQSKAVLFTTIRCWSSKVLVIAGHFTINPRAGNFCKRPHKLIAQIY